MPAYNSGKYLKEAIDSILNQSFTNFELIIINDGSTDNTEEILNNYTDERIKKLRHNSNLGNYPARNYAMRNAKGKYIAVMDSDDISKPDRLQIQFDYMEQNPDVGCAGFGAEIVNEKGNVICNHSFLMDYERVKSSLKICNPMIHSALILRASVLKQNNLKYDELFRYAADYELLTRLVQFTNVVKLPDIILQYRIHPNQISSTKANEQMDFSNIIKELYKI